MGFFSSIANALRRDSAPKQLTAAPSERRSDGWYSALGGWGSGKDKREAVSARFRPIDPQTAETIWRSNDIGARIIETPPNESLRPGFELKLDDKEAAEAVTARLEDLQVVPKFLEAMYFERAYGGAAIWPVINDGFKSLSEPLNPDRISKIDHLLVFEGPRELRPVKWYSGYDSPKLGMPEVYAIQPRHSGTANLGEIAEIHESRLIVFPGKRIARGSQQGSIQGWGDSVFCRIYEVLRDYGVAWSAASVLLHEFSQASFKIKGLANLLASDKDKVIQNRIKAVELSRNAINAVLMDSEEQYERTQTPVTGLRELLDGFAQRVAAAADQPVTLLMGMSPSGLNATGESDIRFFYDRIDVHRALHVRPRLEQMISMVMRSKDGVLKGKEPDVWSIEFNPLWQPSDKEKAETRKIVADTDNLYVQMQAVTPEEVAVSRFGGDTYSMEMIIEDKELDGDEEVDEVEDEAIPDEEVRPTDAPAAPEAPEIQKTAMNGSQISSLVNIVSQVNQDVISRESGIAIIQVAFQMSKEQAEDVIGKPPPKPEPVAPPVEEKPEEEEPTEDETEEEETEDSEDAIEDSEDAIEGEEE